MLRQRLSSGRASRRLTQPLLLEDGRPPGVLTSTIYTISGFTFAAIAWAAITEVREITIASGQIVPRGQVHVLQHLEGGIVAEILVHEGTRVASGQALVRLEPAAAASDRNQLDSRRAGLTLQLLRLDAESRDLVPDFSGVSQEHAALAMEQSKLYGSNVAQRRNEKTTLSARLAQRRSEAAVVDAELTTARAQLEVQREQFAMQSELVKKGYTSRKTYLDAKTNLQRATGDVANLEGKLRTARESIGEAESSLAELDTMTARKIAEERTKAAADLAEVRQQIAKFADRLDRLYLRAPAEGVVQEIVPKAAGEVIKPGDPVARIVPSGIELVADVRIDAKDAGHVLVGAPVDVKFAAYDSSLYGTVRGVVEYVSATTFTPAPGPGAALPGQAAEPYYKATVRLDKAHVGSPAQKRPVYAGLTVQAHIVTGSKSIVRYMLKPVFNSLDVAFRER